MTIAWYGETCLAIEGESGTLLINPSSNLKRPKGPVDILIFTEALPPKADLPVRQAGWERLLGPQTVVIENPGEYDVHGFFILVFDAFAVIQESGRTLAHLARYSSELSAAQIERLGTVQILALKIDKNADEAIRVVNQIEPAVVIPMYSGSSIEEFLKEFGAAKTEPQKKIVLRKNQAPLNEETEVVVLQAP